MSSSKQLHCFAMQLQPVISVLLFALVLKAVTPEERTFLDNFLLPYRILRKVAFNIGLQGIRSRLPKMLNNPRLQPEVPKSVPFPCPTNNTRSVVKPKSVHELRPGDIDVIGAIGDSLTAGFGLLATNVLETLLVESRGASFPIGGQSSWRKLLTLPNILKEFNPKLIGYSLGPSLTTSRASQFNVAEGGAVSDNMPYMTRVLIKRITLDKRVDLKKDWKMVTVFVGCNDFCSEFCYDRRSPEGILEKHRRDLVKVLKLLRDHLPRTFVNIIPPPNLNVLVNASPKPSTCQPWLTVLCPCLIGKPNELNRALYFELMTKWAQVDVEVAKDPQFDLDDFTVVAQAFFLNYTFPKIDALGHLDFTYLSHDCFHFSQKGTAKVANDLWNCMMEPVGRKGVTGNEFLKKFNCPTEESPYIYTRRNSKEGENP